MSYITLQNQHNLRETWEAFEGAISSTQASLIRSTLFRFTIPGLGGGKVSGDRLTNKEALNALNFLSTITITPDTPEILRSAQVKTFEMLNTNKERQRQLRSYLNQFISWGTEHGFFSSALEEPKSDDYEFYPEKIPKQIKTTNRGKSSHFSLSLNPENYATSGLEIEVIERELNRIKALLTSLESYRLNIQGNRQVSIDMLKASLLRLLGWLHREKQIPLEELGFNSLVPFVNLNPKLRDFLDKENPWMEQMLKKAIALEDIKGKAHEVVELLTEFFAWLENPPALNYRRVYVNSLIDLAKYVYRNETDKTIASDFGDIPIINRLKLFNSELEKTNKGRSSKSQYIPWNEVIQVFKNLRFEAKLKTIKKWKKYRGNRSASAIAKSFQKCVLLGMYVLVPPSRQRVIRELELGRTLKYGTFIHEQFTPAQSMANPDEAKYYIHLQPEDYKTGDTYGEWLGEFPNVPFSDGSSFYDYLNCWLFKGCQDDNGNWHGMREVLAQENARTVFVRDETGESLDDIAMGAKIRNIFKRWTKTPITPHALRHIYRTYIADPATGATEKEQESAAFWMRHSNKIAGKVYVHLNCEKKLYLGAVLTDRINKQFLSV